MNIYKSFWGNCIRLTDVNEELIKKEIDYER